MPIEGIYAMDFSNILTETLLIVWTKNKISRSLRVLSLRHQCCDSK